MERKKIEASVKNAIDLVFGREIDLKENFCEEMTSAVAGLHKFKMAMVLLKEFGFNEENDVNEKLSSGKDWVSYLCKRLIEKEVVEAFSRLVNMNADLSVVVFSHKREIFVKTLQGIFKDLRLRNSAAAVTLQDFADLLFEKEQKKQMFFEDVLQTINDVAKRKYKMDEIILEDVDFDSMMFFFDFSKIVNVLNKKYNYATSYVLTRDCRTPYQLADLYYRRGQF